MRVRPRRRRKRCAGCGTSRGLVVKDRRVKRWRHLDSAQAAASSSTSCTGLSAAAAGTSRSSRFGGPGQAPRTRATSKTSSRVCASRWHRSGRAPDHQAAAAVGLGRQDRRAGRRWPPHRRDRVGRARPQRRDLAGILRSAHTERKASIEVVSIDMSAGYQKAIRSETGVPEAAVCFDPFHVVALGGKRSTRSAAPSTTATDALTASEACGSRACATRCSRTPPPDRPPARQAARGPANQQAPQPCVPPA